MITYGIAKCSKCSKDIPYIGHLLVGGKIKDDKLLCLKCSDIEDEIEENKK